MDMGVPEDATKYFQELKKDMRHRGTEIDGDLREIASDEQIRRMRSAYQNGNDEKARNVLHDLLRAEVKMGTVEAKRRLKTARQEVARREETLDALSQRRNVGSKIDYVVGRNVQVARELFGFSKTALADKTGAITRQTLLKIEKGKGLRLGVVEAIARALGVPSEALLLETNKIGVLYELTRPTDPMQTLFREIIDEPNEAALYAHRAAEGDRLDPEALVVVGDVLELADSRYENPAARAGAAIGWLWGLPPGRRPELENPVTRDLLAAAVGGWWTHELAETGP